MVTINPDQKARPSGIGRIDDAVMVGIQLREGFKPFVRDRAVQHRRVIAEQL